MLTKKEAAARLNIHETTLTSWVEHGLVTGHAYNAHYCLYEIPDPRSSPGISRPTMSSAYAPFTPSHSEQR